MKPTYILIGSVKVHKYATFNFVTNNIEANLQYSTGVSEFFKRIERQLQLENHKSCGWQRISFEVARTRLASYGEGGRRCNLLGE